MAKTAKAKTSKGQKTAPVAANNNSVIMNTPGFRFENGHVVGSSGIARPTKFANRAKKDANRKANLSARATIQSARANDPKGKPNWHGAINGTPAVANIKR